VGGGGPKVHFSIIQIIIYGDFWFRIEHSIVILSLKKKSTLKNTNRFKYAVVTCYIQTLNLEKVSRNIRV